MKFRFPHLSGFFFFFLARPFGLFRNSLFSYYLFFGNYKTHQLLAIRIRIIFIQRLRSLRIRNQFMHFSIIYYKKKVGPLAIMVLPGNISVMLQYNVGHIIYNNKYWCISIIYIHYKIVLLISLSALLLVNNIKSSKQCSNFQRST